MAHRQFLFVFTKRLLVSPGERREASFGFCLALMGGNVPLRFYRLGFSLGCACTFDAYTLGCGARTPWCKHATLEARYDMYPEKRYDLDDGCTVVEASDMLVHWQQQLLWSNQGSNTTQLSAHQRHS